MGDDTSNILKRKMAASGRDPGPLHLIADLSRRMGTEAAAAFGEYYGEKCQLGETTAPHFARLDEAQEALSPLRRHLAGQLFDRHGILSLLGGRPIREALAWAGPFVMNTRAEVMEAYQDFQRGSFGQIPG